MQNMIALGSNSNFKCSFGVKHECIFFPNGHTVSLCLENESLSGVIWGSGEF